MSMEKGGLYDFSNPAKEGPGAWTFMHIMAANATTVEKRKYACSVIRDYCEGMKCGDCSGHCQTYTKNNPPENTIGTMDGLFYWTVQFRNDVNKRIGPHKPQYDPQIMYDIFHSPAYMVCEKDCGKGKEAPQPVRDQYMEVKTTRGNTHYIQTAFGVNQQAKKPFGIMPRGYN